MRLTASQKLQILRAYREEGGSLPYTKVLSQFRNGGDLPELGLPEKNSTIVDANNNTQSNLLTGMMKARMAIAAQMGNTSAQRMTSVYPNRYEFTGNEQINGENIGVPKGEVGTHFMSSMGEYAVPFIQERNNKLQFVSNPRYNDAESMRFESPEDAQYFAEHYKDVAPMMQSFATGGELPEDPPVTNLSNYIRDTSSSNDNTDYKSVPLRKGEPPIIGGTLPTVEIKASNTPKNYRNDPISRREDIKTVPITKGNIHNYPVSVQTEFMKQQVADRPNYEAIKDFENFAATGFGLTPIGIVDDVISSAIGIGTKYLPKVVDKVGEILDPFGSKMFPNAYKYNPWAFKPSSDNLYRGLGESGVKDAFESGVLRPRPVELRDIGKDIVTESGKTFRLKGKIFDKTYYSPEFKIADRYGNGYIAEVPKNSATFNNRYSTGKDWSMHTTEHIPIDKANILKKDWLMGYKKINAPKKQFKSEIDWGKWNPDTPKYPELINEYNTIEESTKKAGTWMKNPDGSAFQGTPEQFIQQQSSRFKKAFPNYYNKILNHNSPNKFNEFSDKFFSKTSDEGWYGKGVYTHPDKSYTKYYGDINYELYVNSNNKGFINENNIQGAKYYKKSYKEELKNINNQVSSYIKEIKDNPTDYTDQKFFIERVNNMGKLKKATLKDAFRNKLNNNIDSYSTLENLQNGEVVIPFNNLVKSAVGNVGFFDMANPNIYKSLLPLVGTGYLGNKVSGN